MLLGTFEARITQITNSADVDKLSKAAQEIDRCDLTKAGRGLQKHGSRPASAFPNPTGNVSQINAQGQYEVDNILTFPGSIIKPNKFNGINIYTPDGTGACFNFDGTFRGFLEP